MADLGFVVRLFHFKAEILEHCVVLLAVLDSGAQHVINITEKIILDKLIDDF